MQARTGLEKMLVRRKQGNLADLCRGWQGIAAGAENLEYKDRKRVLDMIIMPGEVAI